MHLRSYRDQGRQGASPCSSHPLLQDPWIRLPHQLVRFHGSVRHLSLRGTVESDTDAANRFGIIYQIPLYFSAVEQTTTSYAGLHLIPNAVFASTASLLAGIYMQKTGYYKKMLIISGVLGVVGPATMIVSTSSSNIAVERN